MKFWGVTCDGQASHPGGVAILLVASCDRNWDKLWLCGPLGSCADFACIFCICFTSQQANKLQFSKFWAHFLGPVVLAKRIVTLEVRLYEK